MPMFLIQYMYICSLILLLVLMYTCTNKNNPIYCKAGHALRMSVKVCNAMLLCNYGNMFPNGDRYFVIDHHQYYTNLSDP